jgi:TPR repeat protein
MQDAEADIKAGRYSQALAKLLPAARAAEDPAAQYLLAAMYFNGNGVPRDEQEGLKWMAKSAELGYGPAEADLGASYLSGKWGIPDANRAKELLLRAAKQGEASAIYNVGVMYRDGLGVARDRTKAKNEFLIAANKGHALAQYGLARIYYDDGSFVEAAQWYERASAQDDLEALYNLAYMYHEGQGVTKDYTKANELFRKTAEIGAFCKDGSRSYKALSMLGNAYAYGEGVSRDFVEAYKWYFLAAARGHPDAPSDMRKVEQSLTNDQITEARNRAKKFVETVSRKP